MEKYELQKSLGIEKLFPITLPLSKFFCQKFATNWTNTCHILLQACGNPVAGNAARQ